MSLRIVCEHCSGELQVPDHSAGSQVRCPFCERIFVCPLAFAGAGSRIGARLPEPTLDDSSIWTPTQEDLEEPTPWYLVLGSLAPLGLLAMVTVEPIAIGVAAVLVGVGLIVATRRSWSILSRSTGVCVAALLALSAAAVAHAYGQGSFANLRVPTPAGPVATTEPAGVDLENVEWKTWTMPKGEGYSSDVTLFAPGELVYRRLPEPNFGLDIHLFRAAFPRQKVIFALQTFDVRPEQGTVEAGESFGLDKIRRVLLSLLHDSDSVQQIPIFTGQHPGFEDVRHKIDERFKAGEKTGEPTRIVVQAYLVRDRAYVLTVGAEKYDAIKPLAEKFFASFHLTKTVPPLRAAMEAVPDSTTIPRPSPRLSLCGHSKPLPLSELAFSADGASLVTGAALDQIVLWNLKTGLGRFLTNTTTFESFAVAPSGKTLVAPVPNGQLAPEFVRFPELKDRSTPPLAPRSSDVIAFQDDKVIVALDTNITVWSLADGAQLAERKQAMPSTIVSLALSRDGKLLATASKDEPIIKLWDSSKNVAVDVSEVKNAHKKVDGGSFPIPQVALSPAKAPLRPELASAGSDGTAKIWSLADINRPKLSATLLHDQPVTCVDFSNDGERLATGDAVGVVRIWHRSSGQLLNEFRASDSPQAVQSVRFSPDDSLLGCAVRLGNQRWGVNLFEMKSLPVFAHPQTAEPPLIKQFEPLK